MPCCSVLVLNWNGKQFLAECLGSLRRQVCTDFETVLVDNGSEDGSVEYVRATFPEVRVFALPQNLGFCVANNMAMQDALSRGADFVLFVNNDTFVAPNFVQEMMKAIHDEPQVAVVCPKIYLAHQPRRLWYAGGDFSLWTARARLRGYNREDHGQFDGLTSITMATGCAMLVRGSASQRVGGFNETLWAYAEDLELSIRFRLAGYEQRFAPNAHMWHLDGGTNVVRGSQAIRQYYSTRNLLYLGRMYARWWQLPTYLLGFTVFEVVFYSLLRLFRADYPAFKAIYRGLWDALRGTMNRTKCELSVRPIAKAPAT